MCNTYMHEILNRCILKLLCNVYQLPLTPRALVSLISPTEKNQMDASYGTNVHIAIFCYRVNEAQQQHFV